MHGCASKIGACEISVGHGCVIQDCIPENKLTPKYTWEQETHRKFTSTREAFLREAPPSRTFRKLDRLNCEKSKFALVRSMPARLIVGSHSPRNLGFSVL